MITRFLYRILCGFFLGISIVAPGFSGSIIAITMGVYEDLLRIMSNPFKQFKKNVIYLVPLAIGAAISAVLFVLIFKYLFDLYPKQTYLLFIGLIAGNLPIIFAEVKKCGFQKHYLIGGVGAFATALAFGIFTVSIGSTTGSGTQQVVWHILVLSGIAGGITAVIPGMSVTMVLIVFGVYSNLLITAEQLLHLNFANVFPFALFTVCALAGMVLSSKVIGIILKKYPGFSNSTILGFMTGALIGILIQSLQIDDPSFNWLLGCIMLAAGLAISMLFVIIGKKVNKPEPE